MGSRPPPPVVADSLPVVGVVCDGAFPVAGGTVPGRVGGDAVFVAGNGTVVDGTST